MSRVDTGGLVPPVGRTTWSVLTLNLLSCFGSGLTKPFLIVYLHEVRGIGLGTAGLLLGSIGFAGLLTMPLAGSSGRFSTPPAGCWAAATARCCSCCSRRCAWSPRQRAWRLAGCCPAVPTEPDDGR